MTLQLSICAIVALSTLGGFVAGRVYGLELAIRRLVRAYEES